MIYYFIMYESYEQLIKETSDILVIDSTQITILDISALQEIVIDKLIYTAVFTRDNALKKKSRDIIGHIAEAKGIYSCSIHRLYKAFGEEKIKGFTIPALNIRTLTYDTARILFKLAKEKQIGAWIFE